MWKVSGIKIGRIQASSIFSRYYTEIEEKVIFLVKHSVPKIFNRNFFSGLVPTESLRHQIQKMY